LSKFKTVEFHKDISNQFTILIDKVKSLIGKNSNLGESKDAVLRHFIKNRLTENYSIGKGYVSNINDSGETSKYMDFIIYRLRNWILEKITKT